jgi:DNA-binding transcriptional MerR regulator
VSKAAEAFRTISEVAEELDVAKHVLRFWEQKFPQVRPMKRGGGRRYYRPEDIDLLRGIHHLLHFEGYTIRGVQKILRTQGLEQVKACWRERAEHPGRQAKAGDAQAAPANTRSVDGRKGRSKQQPIGPELAPEVRRALEKALAELEACRKLLAGSAGAAAPEPVAARRSGR